MTHPRPRRPTIPGVTHRQLDYWIERRYLRLTRESLDRAPGKGNRWRWTDEDVRIATDMGRLRANGFALARAAEIARSGPAAVDHALDLAADPGESP
ncbi:MerR family transcriptional regulator [Micromonospora fluostatini]|uniref:MerR family transcriptional regulator n=1 Tax=Micromonospora sp. JCM 30529 TaxID=3421643 RepID=UPI003D1716AC